MIVSRSHGILSTLHAARLMQRDHSESLAMDVEAFVVEAAQAECVAESVIWQRVIDACAVARRETEGTWIARRDTDTPRLSE